MLCKVKQGLFKKRYNPLPTLMLAVTVKCSRKGLIGSISFSLQMIVRTNLQEGSYGWWFRDLETLSDEEWEQSLKNLFEVSLSSSQYLTQLFIIHRAHYTPLKLYSWGKAVTSNCPRCTTDTGTLIHMPQTASLLGVYI